MRASKGSSRPSSYASASGARCPQVFDHSSEVLIGARERAARGGPLRATFGEESRQVRLAPRLSCGSLAVAACSLRALDGGRPSSSRACRHVRLRIGAPSFHLACVSDLQARTRRKSLYRQIQLALSARSPFIPLIQPARAFVTTTDLPGAVFSGAYGVDLTQVSPT